MKTFPTSLLMKQTPVHALVLAASVLIASTSAKAAVLFSDSFDYGATGGNLNGVTATGSSGLTGNWSYATPSAQYWTYAPTGGLTFGGYGSSGGAASFTQSNFAASVVTRQLNSALGTGTYYLGYLFSTTARANNGSVGSLLLGPSNQSGNTSPAAIFSDEFANNLGGSRVAGTSSANTGSSSAADGTTYLSLSRISLNGTTVGIDRYILTLAQYTYFNGLSGGLDANLNQSLTTGTDSTNVLQKGTQSVANATTSLPYLSFEGYANGGTFTFTYDEVRLSDTGFNALPVPEPSGALLFAMAAGAWFARQRRRLVRLS